MAAKKAAKKAAMTTTTTRPAKAEKAAKKAAKKAAMTTTTTTRPVKAKPEPPPRKRVRTGFMEGTPWTPEDFRKRGYTTLSVKLGPEPSRLLAELKEALDLGTVEVVRQAIEAFHKARVVVV